VPTCIITVLFLFLLHKFVTCTVFLILKPAKHKPHTISTTYDVQSISQMQPLPSQQRCVQHDIKYTHSHENTHTHTHTHTRTHTHTHTRAHTHTCTHTHTHTCTHTHTHTCTHTYTHSYIITLCHSSLIVLSITKSKSLAAATAHCST